MSSNGTATGKASQDGLRPNEEVHRDVSSKGTVTGKASQDGLGSNEGNREFHVNISPEGMATGATPRNTSDDYASQDGCRSAEVKIKVEVHGKYRKLFEDTVKSDWKAAEKILAGDGEAMAAKIMTAEKKNITVLEVAVMAAQDQFVEKLIKRLPRDFSVDILESALKKAASRGRLRIAKALVGKIHVGSEKVLVALWDAISYVPKRKEIFRYLAWRTTPVPSYSTMSKLVMAGHLDIVFHLAFPHNDSTAPRIYEKIKLLRDLAKMESNFRSGARLSFFEKCIYKCIPLCLVDTSFDNAKNTKLPQALKRLRTSLWDLATKHAPFIKRIGESKLKHKYSLEFTNRALSMMTCKITPEILELTSEIILEAASHGISEIVKSCLKNFPELMWDRNFAKKLIEEVINERQIELFRLASTHMSDGDLAGKGLMKGVVKWTPRCASPDVSGAAFLLQRELQWYEVVDRIQPSVKSTVHHQLTKTHGEKTYWEDFVEQRQNLLEEAGQWMKGTSSSCSVVATLIITVAFAAAFTVPGGNNDSTGIPIFLKKGSFMTFAIADALALFSSVTATSMFLAILTSCYTIEDFLYVLPGKMILGLTFLFLSLGFMLVAFGSALTMLLNERLKWIYIPINLLVALPIILFAMLQLPLYFEMVISTFRPRLYRPKKLWK